MKKTAFLILLLLFKASYSQINYYVSNDGKNAYDGSRKYPFKTIQFAINQLTAGDTLNVLQGTYFEKISFEDKDFLSNRIVLRGINLPTLDGSKNKTQNAIIALKNVSNITIEGFEIANNIQNDAQGILVEGAGKNITIRNCKIHDIHFSNKVKKRANKKLNAQGIIVYGTNPNEPISNIKIFNNELYNCRLGYSEGIALNGNVDHFSVKENKVYNLTNIGIDIIGHEGVCSNSKNDQARNGIIQKNEVYNCISRYATSAGIYIDGGKNIKVLENKIYNNGYGIEIGCENPKKATSSIEVKKNIIYNNEIAGLAVGGFNYPKTGKVVNSKFYKNIFFNNTVNKKSIAELYVSYLEDCYFFNNVFYSVTGNLLSISASSIDLELNNNMYFSKKNPPVFYWNKKYYYNIENYKIASKLDKNTIYQDPLFESSLPENFIYKFKEKSQATMLLNDKQDK